MKKMSPPPSLPAVMLWALNDGVKGTFEDHFEGNASPWEMNENGD
jgi:hypothetical protein